MGVGKLFLKIKKKYLKCKNYLVKNVDLNFVLRFGKKHYYLS